MKEILEKKYIVNSRDSDMFGYLKTSALLGFMQDTAADHSVVLGVSRELLVERYNSFWMMVRLWVEMERPIKAHEEVTIKTWHRGPKGASVYRDFDILAGDELVGQAVTNWIIADIEDRKIIKPSIVSEFASSPKPEKTKTKKLGKILMPDNMAKTEVRRIHYSDTDINGHMNNTRYADIACDVSNLSLRENAFVSEIYINYLSECFPGENIALFISEEEEYTYIQGRDYEEKGKFDALIKLSNVYSDKGYNKPLTL